MKHESRVLTARKELHRRGDLSAANCPSRSIFEHLTSKWGTLVLLLLLEGTRRFSELARTIDGVSEKMLAQSLKALEADGFVDRKVYPTVPPKVEYSLTPLGRNAALHLRSFTDWLEEHVPDVMKYRARSTPRSATSKQLATV
jgi:DNA-binding HxlR family transcriptional regulator